MYRNIIKKIQNKTYIYITEEQYKSFIILIHKMADNNNNNNDDNVNQTMNNKLKVHSFSCDELGSEFSCQIIEMVDSLYIWVGDVKAQNMNNLVTAMQSRYDTNAPLTTTIINGPLDTTAEEFSSRLNLRAKKPIFLSYNVECNDEKSLLVEKLVGDKLKELKLV